MTVHLPALVASAALPLAGQFAAAEHADLHLPLTQNQALGTAVVRALFRGGKTLREDVAVELVSRRLEDDTVRYILEVAGERRPAVLGALVAATAPRDVGLREELLAVDAPEVAEGVLSNGEWPVAEQGRVASWATAATFLQWLADRHADDGDVVDGSITDWSRHGAVVHGERLDHDDIAVVLSATLKFPRLLGLATELVGPRLRSAIGTLARDPRTLHRCLDAAERLARGGRGVEASLLVEAVALNPHASLRVQRRAASLARKDVTCPYLSGWRPGVTAGPGSDYDELRSGQVLSTVERNVAARHRTVWSAAQLGLAAPSLAPRQRDRLVGYLTEHGRAAGLDRDTAELVLDRLGVSGEVRERCLGSLRRPHRGPAARISVEAVAASIDFDAPVAGLADEQARTLAGAFGEDAEAWSVAMVVLRDGWDRPLAELVAVVEQLVVRPEVAA